jgi:hypothetical protein
VGAEKQDGQGRDIVVVEEPDEMDEDSRSLEEPPGWLPDGWIMEVCRDDDSSIYRVCTLASISLGLIGVKIYYFLVVLYSTTLPQCPDTHSHQRWRHWNIFSQGWKNVCWSHRKELRTTSFMLVNCSVVMPCFMPLLN